MEIELLRAIVLPFAATTLGAASVFLIREKRKVWLQRSYIGFAAGVMTAASIFSLLLPALESTPSMGRWSFLPVVIGFWIGVLFVAGLEKMLSYLYVKNILQKEAKSKFQKIIMMSLALVLHNIPEGMAVGVVCAGAMAEKAEITTSAAILLSFGIAIQNFPEGTMIAIPLYEKGVKKTKAFFFGMLSGIVEPFAAMIPILAAGAVLSILPYLFSFAAGAMIFVVMEEFIPEMTRKEGSYFETMTFLIGFTFMLILDAVF